jgi:hypothetical protein
MIRELEITQNGSDNNYYQSYSFKYTPVIFIIYLIAIITYLVLHHSFNHGHYKLLYALIALTIVLFFIIINRFRTFKIAVLQDEGIEFRDSYWWLLKITVWRKLFWRDVARLQSVGTHQRNDPSCSIGVKLTGIESKSGRKVSFFILSTHKQYLEYLDYVLNKIPQKKVDENVFEAKNPENVEKFRNDMERRKRDELALSVVINVLMPCLVISGLFRQHAWLFYVMLVLPLTSAFVILFRYYFAKRIKKKNTCFEENEGVVFNGRKR